MESLKTLLIANRGEIAVRIIRTAKYVLKMALHRPPCTWIYGVEEPKLTRSFFCYGYTITIQFVDINCHWLIIYAFRALNVRTIAIYTEPDAVSTHVSLADESVLLEGSPTKAYVDGYDQSYSIYMIFYSPPLHLNSN